VQGLAPAARALVVRALAASPAPAAHAPEASVVALVVRAPVASAVALVVLLPVVVALRAVADRVRRSAGLVVGVATPRSSSRRR